MEDGMVTHRDTGVWKPASELAREEQRCHNHAHHDHT